MAHVFISYSSGHRDLTEQLAKFLHQCGLEVWWDKELAARTSFEWQIHEKLRTAACVVVLWTPGALTSEWVKHEADYALERNMIVSVTAEGVTHKSLPHPYCDHDQHRTWETDVILRDVLAVHAGRIVLEDKRDELPPPGARTPTMLLQAKFGLIPFTGNARLKNDTIDWALSMGPYASSTRSGMARLIHGPGGLGKTRLMIEVAEELRSKGWSAGFLAATGAGDEPSDTPDARMARRERLSKALGYLIRGASDKGLLLVMDYAEGRNDEIMWLFRQIQARPADELRPIRLVLLTRSAGDWWARLNEDDQITRALFGGDRLDLNAFVGITAPHERLELFLNAVEAFAPKLAEMNYSMPVSPESTKQLEERLQIVESNKGYQSGDGYDRPLSIAMEALLYLGSMAPGSIEPGVHNLLANILGMERNHWSKLVDSQAPNEGADCHRLADLGRAVGQVTGLQGIRGRRRIEDLLMADAYYESLRQSRASVREVADDIQKLYGRGEVVSPLEPDLIGEHHVGHTVDEEMIVGCVRWIDSSQEDLKEEYRHKLVSVLQRASQVVHGGTVSKRASDHLAFLIRNHSKHFAASMIDTIRTTSGALSELVTSLSGDLDTGSLLAFNNALPSYSVELLDLSLAVAQSLVMHARHFVRRAASQQQGDSTDEQASEATNQGPNFSQFLISTTKSNTAVITPEIAETLHLSPLVETKSLDFLARMLHALSARYSNSGNTWSSMTAIQEAIVVYQVIAKRNEQIALPVLGTYHLIHSAAQRKLGLLDAALDSNMHAVNLFREMASTQSKEHMSSLASSLSTISITLVDLGRFEEALTSSSEAYGIATKFADENEEDDLVLIAGAATNFGLALASLGRFQESLDPSRKAVEVVRHLATNQEDKYLPLLAANLINFGIRLNGAGRYTDALNTCREGIDILKQSRFSDRGIETAALADGLNCSGTILYQVDKGDEAVAFLREAVSTYRSMVKTNSNRATLNLLARSLGNLSLALGELNRGEEALTAADEAVSIRRNLAGKEPQAFGSDLARSLLCMGDALLAQKRDRDAIGAYHEGLVTFTPFVEKRPAIHDSIARALALRYVQTCQNNKVAPDVPLLERLAVALGLQRQS